MVDQRPANKPGLPEALPCLFPDPPLVMENDTTRTQLIIGMVLHVSTDLIAQLTPIKFLVNLNLSVLHPQ